MPEDILGGSRFQGRGWRYAFWRGHSGALALLQEADEIVVAEIKAAGLYSKIWQSFAVLLPVMSVGVMGDQRPMRTRGGACGAFGDGMTADWTPLPYEVLNASPAGL